MCACLEEVGIKAYGYQENKYTPPVALVVPAENDYVTMREGDRFGQINVAVQVLLIGPRAGAKASIETFDELILDALKALGDEFDVVSIQTPGEAVVNGVNYYALIISIEAQININDYNKEEEE